MKRLVLSLLISCLPLWFFAQSISVNAEMDSACIWIGEQTKFKLSAIQPKDKQVVFPLFSDSIVNGLEIVDYCKKDTVLLPSGEIKVSESYVVTSFDSAMIFVPNMPVVDGNDTFFTNPLVLKVLSVPIDTTQHAIASYSCPGWRGIISTRSKMNAHGTCRQISAILPTHISLPTVCRISMPKKAKAR